MAIESPRARPRRCCASPAATVLQHPTGVATPQCDAIWPHGVRRTAGMGRCGKLNCRAAPHPAMVASQRRWSPARQQETAARGCGGPTPVAGSGSPRPHDATRSIVPAAPRPPAAGRWRGASGVSTRRPSTISAWTSSARCRPVWAGHSPAIEVPTCGTDRMPHDVASRGCGQELPRRRVSGSRRTRAGAGSRRRRAGTRATRDRRSAHRRRTISHTSTARLQRRRDRRPVRPAAPASSASSASRCTARVPGATRPPSRRVGAAAARRRGRRGAACARRAAPRDRGRRASTRSASAAAGRRWRAPARMSIVGDDAVTGRRADAPRPRRRSRRRDSVTRLPAARSRPAAARASVERAPARAGGRTAAARQILVRRG